MFALLVVVCLSSCFRGERKSVRETPDLEIGDLVSDSVPRPPQPLTGWEKADLETKRLPPDSFPELPQSIREYLGDRGYTIPQAYRPSRPHNVISGEFRCRGVTDFAVLASKDRVSRITIFWGGSLEDISGIAERKDISWLQGIGRGKIGFSRAIMVAKGVSISKACRIYGEAELQEIDHDGIEDYFLGKASIIHCLVNGEWIGVLGAD